jgi:hypothetical protein
MAFLMGDLLEKCKRPAPTAERQRTGRGAKIFEYDGQAYTMRELARKESVRYSTMKNAIYHVDGDAVEAVDHLRQSRVIRFIFNGEAQSQKSIAEQLGVSLSALRHKIKRDGFIKAVKSFKK